MRCEKYCLVKVDIVIIYNGQFYWPYLWFYFICIILCENGNALLQFNETFGFEDYKTHQDLQQPSSLKTNLLPHEMLWW